MKVSELNESNSNLRNIGKTFNENIDIGRTECPIARLHYVDVRQTNIRFEVDTTHSYIDRFMNDINYIAVQTDPFDENSKDLFAKSFFNITQNLFFIDLVNKIISGKIQNYEDIYDLMTFNIVPKSKTQKLKQSYYKKEIQRSNFSNISLFIDNYKHVVLASLSNTSNNVTPFDELSNWITSLWEMLHNNSFIMSEQNIKNDMTEELKLQIIRESFISQKLNGIFIINANIMDLYTLSRIFKNFDNNNIQTQRINPITPKNIIVYAGYMHVQNYIHYLRDYEQFDIVEQIDQNQNCIEKKNVRSLLNQLQIRNTLMILTARDSNILKNISGLYNSIYTRFGPVNILNIFFKEIDEQYDFGLTKRNKHSNNILYHEIDTFLNSDKVFDMVCDYVLSNDEMKKHLIHIACSASNNVHCLDVRSLRQPLFTD